MSKIKGEKATSKIVTLLVVAFIGLIFVFTADFFLPWWRWTKLDWQEMSQRTGVPVDQLNQKQDYVIRYSLQRGGNSDKKYNWQIIVEDPVKTKLPEWVTGPEGEPLAKDAEYKTLVRCQLISDRTGRAPRQPWEINPMTTHYDQYFRCEGWRLPPDAIDPTGKGRCTLLIDVQTLEKMNSNDSISWKGKLQNNDPDTGWLNDDDWQERQP